MGCPVSELKTRLTPLEFAEWMIFDRLEPIGGLRGDYQAAVIASTVANVNRGKNRRALKIEDFMLFKPQARPRRGKQAAGQAMVDYLRGKKQRPPAKKETS